MIWNDYSIILSMYPLRQSTCLLLVYEAGCTSLLKNRLFQSVGVAAQYYGRYEALDLLVTDRLYLLANDFFG